MALSRYTIRNEYSLADPELYKSADKDDPEALLEGVAMAGLVGVLRQLGDLAQFAAVVFHNLHEEVIATAARGHSLKARVQQLEVEFPLIEKALLSQTNHSGFFYTAGVDWHPNVHIDQNYITKVDLPRFIMDSYEEARAPPRLFLLDKFDVAGAGACLKRFTDPSFYKVEAAALGITNSDVLKDKRVRKGKRRGIRWRNGETPEVQPTPQAKLHQLLLKERIENSTSYPARRVKLKRRLNGFPFDLKTGKSYMEKILRTPPPGYRELHEVYNLLPLKLLHNNFMPELEIDDFGSESPGVELTHRSQFSSPDLKDGVRNVSMREMEFGTSNESNHFKPESEREEMGLNSPDLLFIHRSPPSAPGMTASVPHISTDEQEFEAFGIESKDVHKLKNNLEVSNITSTLYDDVVEKQIMVDIERRSEGSSLYQSDDVVSELENYMDALATVEPEMDSDSELRMQGNLHFLSNGKRISALDAATSLRQAHFSDSQSTGSNTLSDDGNSLSKKCRSNSSYSGSPRILAKKHLDDELSEEIDSSNDTGKAKTISSPLKWRGRTRNAGGSEVAASPPYSSDDVKQTFSDTAVSPRVFAHRDADASVSENGVSQLKLEDMSSPEGVSVAEPSKDTGSKSNLNPNVPSNSTSHSPLQMENDSLFRVVAENHSLDDEDDVHLTESSPRLPITPADTCFTGGSKDQHMDELVDKNMYMQDVSPASCTLDGDPMNFGKYHSSCPKFQPLNELANDDTRMSEHPSKPSPEELSKNGLHEDLPNDAPGTREVIGVLCSASIHSSCYNEDTAEEQMSQPSLDNMPQAGGGEHDFDTYPVVNQIGSQITIMLPAEEQIMEPRLPELETDIREIDAKSNDEIEIGAVLPPIEVAVEESQMFPFERDLCSENFHISGMADILQPLDSVDSSIDNQIEEQLTHMSEKQFLDTSLSKVEDFSDVSDHNVSIPADMEDQALSGIHKGGDNKDIQVPVVLDSVPQPDVEFSDNRDEILLQPPSLAVRVVTYAVPAGETDLGTVSQSVKRETWVLNELHSSVTADDILLHNGAMVETSSHQMENLHDLARLAGEELEGVASSTDLGERSGNTDCGLIAGSVNTSDTVVEGSKVDSNLYSVDTNVPFSVMCYELNTEEKGDLQKVSSPSTVYGHSESKILDKLSNSNSESEGSLHTDITVLSTLERSGSNINGVFAEKITLDDDSMDVLPVPIDDDVEEPKVTLTLQQLDAEGTEAFRISGESNMHCNVTDKSVLEQSEFSSKWVQSEKDTSPMSIPRDVEEQKVKLPIHQFDEEKIQVSTVEGEYNVLLEPLPRNKEHSDLLLDQEAISGIDSIIFSRNLPGQHSDSELLPQEKLKIDDVDQHNKPLGSIYPAFCLLPEVVNTDSVEMPPLPPLPPVQWRMGKTQQAFLPHETSVLSNDSILLPSMSADHRAQAPKLIVPSLVDAADNSLLTISDTSDQDRPSSLQMPMSVNHANISHLQSLGGMPPVDQTLPFPGSNPNLLSLGELQLLNNNLAVPENCADLADVTEIRFPSQTLLLPANKFPSLSETQSSHQDLPLPSKLDEMSRHDNHTSASLNAPSSGTNLDMDAACDVELVVDSANLAQCNNAQETSLNTILSQGSANSENNASTHDAGALLAKINGGWPHNMMLSLEREAAWPAQDEGKPYGVRPMKPPRQRNPLIDAVIALDKSKLRKVAEQPKTQIQKVDERDSVLKNVQLRKVAEQPRTQMQKTDERDSVLENLQLRKVTEHPRTQIQKADERDSVLENFKLRKVTEHPRTQFLRADESDSVLENLQLRKVTELPSTQIQMADERDSLLEQIRTKTFNLKPSVSSRPAVQGPTTSLKVAAILEKAKTIRQAFAGSDDDDDDDDSWSDS